jgi:hypothetical protein
MLILAVLQNTRYLAGARALFHGRGTRGARSTARSTREENETKKRTRGEQKQRRRRLWLLLREALVSSSTHHLSKTLDRVSIGYNIKIALVAQEEENATWKHFSVNSKLKSVEEIRNNNRSNSTSQARSR